MSVPTWAVSKAAIHNWIRNATGYPDANVVWSQETAARPSAPWAEIRLVAVDPVGQDQEVIEDNPTPSSGEEILFIGRGMRAFTLTVQVFGVAPPAAVATTPTEDLSKVVAHRYLTPVDELLNEAGVGIAAIEPILTIDGRPTSSILEPRAVATFRGFLASEVSVPGTYIETVEVTSTINP